MSEVLSHTQLTAIAEEFGTPFIFIMQKELQSNIKN